MNATDWVDGLELITFEKKKSVAVQYNFEPLTFKILITLIIHLAISNPRNLICIHSSQIIIMTVLKHSDWMITSIIIYAGTILYQELISSLQIQ